MNNEEKNLTQNESADEIQETQEIKEVTPKKLSTGALIGIIAGAVAVVVAVVILIIALGGKCEHVDSDDDYFCDNCGDHFDDGDENPVPGAVEAEVAITVTLDNGNTLGGVKFSLVRGDATYELTSGSDGTVKQKIPVGTYEVFFDSDSLPQYCYGETFGVKIEEGTTDVSLKVVDNRPDGSARKPFPFTENTEITLADGEEHYFSAHGVGTRFVTINNGSLVINYNGETYSPVDGVISVAIVSENTDTPAIFSVKNTSGESVTTLMEIASPLGSTDNPIKMTDSTAVANVPDGKTVYYTYTADKDGVLLLTSPTVGNSISITRYVKIVYDSGVEDIIPILSGTDNSSSAYIYVMENEEIKIGVSFTAPQNSVKVSEGDEENEDYYQVAFNVQVYAGTQSEPVPVYKSTIGLTLEAGCEIVFSSDSDKTVTLKSGENVELVNNGSSFSLSNGSAEATNAVVEILDPLGTNNNQIKLTDTEAELSVTAGNTVYYSWTARQSGVLVITSPDASLNILIKKEIVRLVENDGVFEVTTLPVSVTATSASSSHIYVSAGDVLTFAVSNIGATDVESAALSFEIISGGRNTAISVNEGGMTLTLGANISLTFSAEEGRTVRISNAHNLSVAYNGNTLEPDVNDEIVFTVLDNTKFDLRVTANDVTEITITLE